VIQVENTKIGYVWYVSSWPEVSAGIEADMDDIMGLTHQDFKVTELGDQIEGHFEMVSTRPCEDCPVMDLDICTECCGEPPLGYLRCPVHGEVPWTGEVECSECASEADQLQERRELGYPALM